MAEAQYSRIDTMEDLALHFAEVLLDPDEKDAQKRADQRAKAHENLVRAITSLASQARSNEDYMEVLAAGMQAFREAAQNPPTLNSTNPGGAVPVVP